MPSRRQKVLVCLSGGVDSSVTAALLVQAGYDVTGAYMKQWSDSGELKGVCPWKQDRRDALRVAARLGIPFLTLDFEKEYRDWVMDYMFREYKAGKTPNPDVMCNRWIKFGFWLDKVQSLGFEFMATGHYAKVKSKKEKGKRRKSEIKKLSGHTQLLEAKDKDKDQTYFLHQLSQKQLEHVLFPIGEYTKKEVRALAKKFQLPTADRAESMGICFVGEVPMKEFLQQKIRPKPGRVVTSAGEVIGEHEGLAFYTIGQRHLKVKSKKLKTCPEGFEGGKDAEDTKPLYVVDKRLKTNELVVGFENDPLLYKQEIEVGEVSWVSGQAPEFPLECEVRLRHRQTLQRAKVKSKKLKDKDKNKETKITIEFAEAQRAVTPGQFAVMYKDGECLGGGVIQ